MTTIKELRTRIGLTQTQFANAFDIPVKTIQSWEQEQRTPPEYVIKLLERVIRLNGYERKEL